MIELCERLDGIPLAIELAAARSRALQPAELLARLDDRFRLLRGDRHDAIARHQTLRSAVAWSYELLPVGERVLFDRLSICSGGFDLAAAEWLGGALDADDAEALDELDVIDVLDHLVARSLVVAEEEGGRTRFRLLQTLREYGLEQLGRVRSPSPGRAASRRVLRRGRPQHPRAARRARRAPGARTARRRPRQRAGHHRLVHHARPRQRAGRGQRAVAVLGQAQPGPRGPALARGHRRPRRRGRRAERALLDDQARARLYERLGVASFQTGVDVEQGIERLLTALEIHTRNDDRFRMARVHARIAQNLSSFPQLMDIDRALHHAREAEDLLPTNADARSLIDVFSAKAAIALYARRNGEGLDASKRVLRLTRQLPSPRPHLYALASMGTHLGYCGRLDEGFALLEQSWTQAQDDGDAFARFLAVWRRGFGAVLAARSRRRAALVRARAGRRSGRALAAAAAHDGHHGRGRPAAAGRDPAGPAAPGRRDRQRPAVRAAAGAVHRRGRRRRGDHGGPGLGGRAARAT